MAKGKQETDKKKPDKASPAKAKGRPKGKK
jgi:hypothetical protein